MSIIKVEGLSKRYIIGHDRRAGGTNYQTFREMLSHSARGMYQRLRHPFSPNRENTELEEFWALKDVNFEVKQGERVGIIGRNGAGKSTLLKILSRITEPTTGKITLNGRVASLLEVGTGFHPELSGRENIYLNGAVLGMTRAEIKKKFDEIVDFSGVEKFLDTPVKRYSSGMYVRLAFSVAAHLEPEILLVDEVLAVGDAEFQKKCLGKMEDVSKEGRTVLFISHNMAAVKSLCSKGILIREGAIIAEDKIYNVVSSYQKNLMSKSKPLKRNIGKKAYIESILIKDISGKIKDCFNTYEDITIEIKWFNKGGTPVNVCIEIVNNNDIVALVAYDTNIDWYGKDKSSVGAYLSTVVIPGNLLNANDYKLGFALDCSSPRTCYESYPRSIDFSIIDPMNNNCLARGNFTSTREDAVLWPLLNWSFKKLN